MEFWSASSHFDNGGYPEANGIQIEVMLLDQMGSFLLHTFDIICHIYRNVQKVSFQYFH